MRWAWFGLALVFSIVFGGMATTQVSILSPKDGETVRSRRLVVRTDKPDKSGYIMVWLNGKFVAAVASPFELVIDLAQLDIFLGTHTLRVVGRDGKGKLEGEAEVRFAVELGGADISPKGVRLELKSRVGEFAFYTLRAVSETKAEVPLKAIREKVPMLSTKLTLRWNQVVRDITADRQFKVVRVVEEGTLERGGFMPSNVRPTDDQRLGLLSLLPSGEVVMGVEAPSVIRFTAGNTDIAFPERELKVGESWVGSITLPRNLENLWFIGGVSGGAPAGFGAPMGDMPGIGMPSVGGVPGRMGVPPGAPSAGGIPGNVPAPPTGGIPAGQQPELLLADAPVVRVPALHRLDGFELWNDYPCARIVSTFKAEVELELGQTATTAGAIAPMGGMPMGGPGVAPMGGMPMGGPGVAPMGGMPMGGPGVAPMGGMPMGGPGIAPMGGMPMGGPGIGVPPMGAGGRGIGVGGMPGQAQPQWKLSGLADGTRILLFDLENGRVVYVRAEIKVTFSTDYVTVLTLLPQQQQVPTMAGAPAGAPGMMPGGMPMGGMPMGEFGGEEMGMPGMPGRMGMPGMGMPGMGMPGMGMPGRGIGQGGFGGGPGMAGGPGIGGIMPGGAPTIQQPTFRNVPAKLRYTVTLENMLDEAKRIDQWLKSLSGTQ